jgi:hypothetical protein
MCSLWLKTDPVTLNKKSNKTIRDVLLHQMLISWTVAHLWRKAWPHNSSCLFWSSTRISNMSCLPLCIYSKRSMEHGAPWSCGQEFSHLVGRSNDVILKAAKENGLTCCHLERKKVLDLSKQDSIQFKCRQWREQTILFIPW